MAESTDKTHEDRVAERERQQDELLKLPPHASVAHIRPTADGYDLDAVSVSQLGSIRHESGWGDGTPFPGSKDWSMYIDYNNYWGCPPVPTG